MHALAVSFPVFVKDYWKSSLAMFEIETVPVPIPDKSNRVDSYTKVNIQTKQFCCDDYNIQLHMTELIMCKSVRYMYYCGELFVLKHKSKHSCASAIFYDLGPKEVARNCHFDYIYNMTLSSW